MNSKIKTTAETLLLFHENGFDYDKNLEYYTRTLDQFRKAIEADFIHRTQLYAEPVKDINAGRATKEMGEVGGGFTPFINLTNERQFDNPERIEEV